MRELRVSKLATKCHVVCAQFPPSGEFHSENCCYFPSLGLLVVLYASLGGAWIPSRFWPPSFADSAVWVSSRVQVRVFGCPGSFSAFIARQCVFLLLDLSHYIPTKSPLGAFVALQPAHSVPVVSGSRGRLEAPDQHEPQSISSVS